MNLLYKLTTRSRPQKALATIKSIADNISKENYHSLLVSVDDDDESCGGEFPKSCLNVSDKFNPQWVKSGKSENKINAINRDVDFWRMYHWDCIINVSDDVIFTKKDFDIDIAEAFAGDYDKCLHFPDGYQSHLITVSVLGRKYYDRFGYIYHPDYKSLYCDDEQTQVAMMLGKHQYVDKNIFEHRHPAWGKAEMDAQYVRTQAFDAEDKKTFFRRKFELNFDLPKDLTVKGGKINPSNGYLIP